jgi:hypothetical protein
MDRYPVTLLVLLRIRFEKLAAPQGYPPLAQKLAKYSFPEALKATTYE